MEIVDLRKYLDNLEEREGIISVSIAWEKKIIEPLERAQRDLAEILSAWDDQKDNPWYITYIESFYDDIVKLRELRANNKINQDADTGISWLDQEIDENDHENMEIWSLKKIIKYRAAILSGKFFDADICEDFLEQLFGAQNKMIWEQITKEIKNANVKNIEEENKIITQVQKDWYDKWVDCIDIIMNFHPKNQSLATLAGYFMFDTILLEQTIVVKPLEDTQNIPLDKIERMRKDIEEKHLHEAIIYYQRAVSQSYDIDEFTHQLYIDILEYQNKTQELEQYILQNNMLDITKYWLEEYYKVVQLYQTLWESAYRSKEYKKGYMYMNKMLDIVEQYIKQVAQEWWKFVINKQTNILKSTYSGLLFAPIAWIKLLKERCEKHNKHYYLPYLADLYFHAKQYEQALKCYEALWYDEQVWDCYKKMERRDEANTAYWAAISEQEETWEDTPESIKSLIAIYDKCFIALSLIKDTEYPEKVHEIIYLCEKALAKNPENKNTWETRLLEAYYIYNVINTTDPEGRHLPISLWLDLAQKYLKNNDIKSAIKACIYAMQPQTSDIQETWKMQSIQTILTQCIQKAELEKKDDIAQQGRAAYDIISGWEE